MQSAPRTQVPNKEMKKVQESFWYFELSEAVSSLTTSKGIFFSYKDLHLLQNQGLGGMRPFNCQSFLKGIKLLVF